MSANKIVTASGYKARGTSFTKMAYSQGFRSNLPSSISTMDGRLTIPTGGMFSSARDENRSWATNGNGSTVDSTGAVLFDNDAQGGYLREILIANRGPNTVYIGFNSSSISATSGSFPLASGESMEREGYITSMWAVAAANGSGLIAAQGLFGNHSRII